MPNQNHKMACVIVTEALKYNSLTDLIMLITADRPAAIVNAACNALPNSPLQQAYKNAVIFAGNHQKSLFEREMIAFCKTHHKIASIKEYRSRTQEGLREAKEYVEALALKYGFEFLPYNN
jgi:ribosomal protein L7/L12